MHTCLLLCGLAQSRVPFWLLKLLVNHPSSWFSPSLAVISNKSLVNHHCSEYPRPAGMARPGDKRVSDFRRIVPQLKSKNLHAGPETDTTEMLLKAPVTFQGSVGILQAPAPPPQKAKGAAGADGAGLEEECRRGGAQRDVEEARKSWLETFSTLCQCSARGRAGAAGEAAAVSLSNRTEFLKKRAFVSREVQHMLGGVAAGRTFQDAVDALDQKTRADMLDEVAAQLSVLGVFLRLQSSMGRLSSCGLDSTLCRQVGQRPAHRTRPHAPRLMTTTHAPRLMMRALLASAWFEGL